MRLQSPWEPRLTDNEGAPSDRLVAALAEDIVEGRIEAGARLPAHRDLAIRLSMGLGSVTKAYAVLERRGLVRSVKGRGTFVAAVQARRGSVVDLSRNAPPAAMTEQLLSRTLVAIARRIDAGLFNSYPPIAGHGEYRRQLARWFAGLGMQADPDRLLLTSGAHHALSVAFSAACGPTGTIFAEAHTYPGAIALCRHMGCRLVGVALDGEGLMPEALDRALATREKGPAALYVTPTLQNPTATTMGLARRQEIVSICRARDIVIIEDDVYRLTAEADSPPLAMLAPERTFYANSMSKTLNPALRIGGLVAPKGRYDRAEAILQATALMVSPMSCAVMEQWLIDGTAGTVSREIQEESRRRHALAQSFLGDAIGPAGRHGYHVWIPMSWEEAHRLDDAARALGVVVTPPSSTVADPMVADGGVRLCIGAPSFAELTGALGSIAALLSQMRADHPRIPTI